MKITREHYQQLVENFKATRHLMSDRDCEEMRVKLNSMREHLAFEACASAWKKGETINCYDFLRVCETTGVHVSEHVYSWVMADILEIGQQSYSCIGKIHKTKEKTLQKLCLELTAKIGA